MQNLFCLFFLAAALAHQPAMSADSAAAPAFTPKFSALVHNSAAAQAEQPALRADFKQHTASAEARSIADWVVDSADNQRLPFAIVDKVQAQVFVFYADGRLRGAAPVLLGLAIGDDSVPGIGERALASIRPEERTTPAGRFVAALDRDLHGQEVLWVDYDTAVSLHPVVTSQPKDRRAQRLASSTPLDNRISYGCINVALNFYQTVVSPAFRGTEGIVYVLPETRSARELFGAYDVDENARRRTGTGISTGNGTAVSTSAPSGPLSSN